MITFVFKVLCNGIHSARQWTASVLRHVHILLNNSNGKTPKSENHAQNVLKSEMLGIFIFCETTQEFQTNKHMMVNFPLKKPHTK